MKWSNLYQRILNFSQNMLVVLVLIIIFILIIAYIINLAK